MNILFSILLSLFLTTVVQAKVLTLNEILESTCRVKAGSAYGSGTCFKHEGGKYYILTNAHVIGNSRTVSLEFFKNGHKTLPISATVVFKKLIARSDVDLAIVAVDGKYFGNYPPRVAKVAPRDAKGDNSYMLSAGCPSARWASAWEGTIKEEKGGRIIFYPPPIGGQSGSGLYIVNNGNTVLKGVVTWRIGNSGRDGRTGYERAQGAAVNIDRLYDVIAGRVEYNRIPDNYQTVNYVKAPVDKRDGGYGYGNDCYFYPIVNGYVHKPDNVRIIAYHVTRPQYFVHCDSNGWYQAQCPPGGCEPILPFFRRNPNPGNPYPDILPIPDRDGTPAPNPGNRTPNNPYNFLPDRDGDVPPEIELPEQPPAVNPLQEELDSVQAEKAGLIAELEKANEQIAQKTDEMGALNKQIDEAKAVSGKIAKDYAVLQSEKVDIRNEYEALQSTVDELHVQIQKLINESAITQEHLAKLIASEQSLYAQTLKDETALEQMDEIAAQQKTAIVNRDEIIDHQVEYVLEQKEKVAKLETTNGYFTTGAGAFGIGALLFLIRKFYPTARRNKVKAGVDKVQNIVEDRVTDVAGEGIGNIVRAAMEAFESRISSRIDAVQNNVNTEINSIHQTIQGTIRVPGPTVTHNLPPITGTTEERTDKPILDALDGVYDILGKIQEYISEHRSSKKKINVDDE